MKVDKYIIVFFMLIFIGCSKKVDYIKYQTKIKKINYQIIEKHYVIDPLCCLKINGNRVYAKKFGFQANKMYMFDIEKLSILRSIGGTGSAPGEFNFMLMTYLSPPYIFIDDNGKYISLFDTELNFIKKIHTYDITKGNLRQIGHIEYMNNKIYTSFATIKSSVEGEFELCIYKYSKDKIWGDLIKKIALPKFKKSLNDFEHTGRDVNEFWMDKTNIYFYSPADEHIIVMNHNLDFIKLLSLKRIFNKMNLYENKKNIRNMRIIQKIGDYMYIKVIHKKIGNNVKKFRRYILKVNLKTTSLDEIIKYDSVKNVKTIDLLPITEQKWLILGLEKDKNKYFIGKIKLKNSKGI